MKKNALWLFIVLALATLAVPTSVMADGNPMPSCTTAKCNVGMPSPGDGR